MLEGYNRVYNVNDLKLGDEIAVHEWENLPKEGKFKCWLEKDDVNFVYITGGKNSAVVGNFIKDTVYKKKEEEKVLYRVPHAVSDKMTAAMAELEVLANLTSHDPKTRVGAGLLCPSTFRLLATSVNGFLPGAADNVLPNLSPLKHTYMRHAERNLINYCAKVGIAMEGKILLVTHSPCYECSRSLLEAGITKIYFKNLHKMSGESFINKMDLCSSIMPVGEFYLMKIFPLSEPLALAVAKRAGIL